MIGSTSASVSGMMVGAGAALVVKGPLMVAV